MFGGIPDIFQPPVYYTVQEDGDNTDKTLLTYSDEITNYFIRNYGGF